jgi:acyl carrier protein
MLPTTLMALEAMPLLPNGKIDRKALPDPRLSRAQTQRPTWVAPRTVLEQRLAGWMGELLEVERVGLFDGFFELGGHSLLATRLVARIRQELGIEVPLAELFDQPTVAALAACLGDPENAEKAEKADPITRLLLGEEAPLSSSQERLWFLDRLEGSHRAYNLPASVRLKGRLKGAALHGGLNEILRRHETLRTRFEVVEGEGRPRVENAGALPLPQVSLRGLPTGRRPVEARRLAQQWARRPFDLAHGPLLRCLLLELGEESHRALVTTSFPTVGRWRYFSMNCRFSMTLLSAASRQPCQSCRFSTPTMPPGSATVLPQGPSMATEPGGWNV